MWILWLKTALYGHYTILYGVFQYLIADRGT